MLDKTQQVSEKVSGAKALETGRAKRVQWFRDNLKNLSAGNQGLAPDGEILVSPSVAKADILNIG